MPDWSGRTSPSLDFAAEMLDTMDLDGLQRRDRSSDRVRSNICLGPMSTLLKVYHPSGIDGSWISRRLDNDSRRIGDDNHGTRFSEKDSRLLQGRLSRREQFRMLRATMDHFRLGGDASLASFNGDVVLLRTLP
jgi:hypothetical protein